MSHACISHWVCLHEWHGKLSSVFEAVHACSTAGPPQQCDAMLNSADDQWTICSTSAITCPRVIETLESSKDMPSIGLCKTKSWLFTKSCSQFSIHTSPACTPILHNLLKGSVLHQCADSSLARKGGDERTTFKLSLKVKQLQASLNYESSDAPCTGPDFDRRCRFFPGRAPQIHGPVCHFG